MVDWGKLEKLDLRRKKARKIARRKAEISKRRMQRESKPLQCHFCKNEWDSKQGKCLVCPKCYAPYSPLNKGRALGGMEKSPKTPELGKFGNELRAARVKKGWSQKQAAEYFHVSPLTFIKVELGHSLGKRAENKLLRERMRIWIESERPLRERKQEIDKMFEENKEN